VGRPAPLTEIRLLITTNPPAFYNDMPPLNTRLGRPSVQ